MLLTKELAKESLEREKEIKSQQLFCIQLNKQIKHFKNVRVSIYKLKIKPKDDESEPTT